MSNKNNEKVANKIKELQDKINDSIGQLEKDIGYPVIVINNTDVKVNLVALINVHTNRMNSLMSDDGVILGLPKRI